MSDIVLKHVLSVDGRYSSNDVRKTFLDDAAAPCVPGDVLYKALRHIERGAATKEDVESIRGLVMHPNLTKCDQEFNACIGENASTLTEDKWKTCWNARASCPEGTKTLP